MRIPPDIISEILLITKENYQYKKQIAKQKYNQVILELYYNTEIWQTQGNRYTQIRRVEIKSTMFSGKPYEFNILIRDYASYPQYVPCDYFKF